MGDLNVTEITAPEPLNNTADLQWTSVHDAQPELT